MKALLERHNSLYPSNTRPVPNLRKCKSSVNKAEAAPLQFSPHSGGEGSISGESMVSLWLTHSKGSGEGGVREYLHVCRSLNIMYLILQFKIAGNIFTSPFPFQSIFMFSQFLGVLQILQNVLG